MRKARSRRVNRFRTLNIVMTTPRERLAIEVDTSLGGMRVVRVLEELRQIRSDNGPEFVSRAVDQRANEQRLRWQHDSTRTTGSF